MKKTKILTSIVITVLLIMSFMALLASATTLPAITLSASSVQLPIMLPTGTTFNGSISTTGTVRFWVSAPNGAQIVNLGLIEKTTAFSFIAKQNGNYTMNFENDLTNSIQVTFTYVINPDLSSSNNSTGIPLVYLVTSIFIAILGSILIIFFKWRKNKFVRLNIKMFRFQSLLHRYSQIAQIPFVPNLFSIIIALLTIVSSSVAFSIRLLMARFIFPPK